MFETSESLAKMQNRMLLKFCKEQLKLVMKKDLSIMRRMEDILYEGHELTTVNFGIPIILFF